MTTDNKSVYEVLSAIDCRKESRKKNGLTYLPWAWAWARVKENFPGAFYTIYENKDGFNYHTDGRTAWVKCGVTICDLEMCEYLPVMDFRNSSIPADKVTSFDVNKSIQRCLTKACARHGLGLYIFAGEDLPEGAEETGCTETNENAPSRAPNTPTRTATPPTKKTQPSASSVDSALKDKAKEAWTMFKALDSVKSMDENSRSKFFFTTLKSKVGKSDPAKLTAEDWEKVISELDVMGAI